MHHRANQQVKYKVFFIKRLFLLLTDLSIRITVLTFLYSICPIRQSNAVLYVAYYCRIANLI